MSRPRLIERVKNVSLVVLFLSTILLLYFFWGNISFKDLGPAPAQAADEVPETVSILKPAQIVVNVGGDNYTVVAPGDIWLNQSEESSFVKELGRFGPAENILVEEITRSQYLQVMKFESIWADFNYDIPLSDFCEAFQMKKPQRYDVIETVTSIGYSTAEGGKSIYIHDGKNGKCYRLVADADETGDNSADADFPSLIASIKERGYNIYYPASSYFGLEIENNTLVPLSVETNLKNFPFRQELYSYQTEKIGAVAEQFFGRNFDFVRKITEKNGTIIYMYGYGQNVLIVNTDGSIEYKEEQIDDNKGQSFTRALETAVNFVANHGSWKSLAGVRLTPYIENVIPNPNKKEGFRFVFGMELNGNRIYYEEGAPIIVDVTCGQVTYYKRQLIDFNRGDIEAIETASFEDAFSAVNLIAHNYKYIYDVLLPSGAVKATSDQTVENIAAMVNNMNIGYVKQSGDDITEIQPAWVVSANGAYVYFDLYTAAPIGFTLK